MRIKDLAWLAGYLEGEGTFIMTTTPAVCVTSSDIDVIDHAGQLMQSSLPKRMKRTDGHKGLKPMYRTYLYGDSAIVLMKALLPYMGLRRAERIREVLAQAAARPGPITSERAFGRKLRRGDVWEIRRLHNLGVPGKTLARMWRITRANVSMIVLRHTWRNI